MSALATLAECAETQKRLFYKQFLNNNKIGEIVCVNGFENSDSFLFERMEVHGVGFIVTFRLVGEDSLISEGLHFEERPVAQFVLEKKSEMEVKYKKFMDHLKKENKTLATVAEDIRKAGGDPSVVDYKEFTRDILEDSMHPGRRRINGDRNTRIQVMYRQEDIPNDLQKPALEVFELPMPDEVSEFLLAYQEDAREAWIASHLVPCPPGLDMGCHLPFLKQKCDVKPVIYRFPERELDMERAANL